MRPSPSTLSRIALTVLLAVGVTILLQDAAANGMVCRAFDKSSIPYIEHAIDVQENFPSGEPLDLKSIDKLPGSCSRRVTFSAPRLARSASLIIIDDQRYAAESLIDLSPLPGIAKSAPSPQTPRLIETRFTAEEIAGTPSLGPPSAPVTIIEFSDFECPFCKHLAQTLERDILPRHRSDVRLVFLQLPLRGHPWAEQGAELSECALQGSTGSFWRVHDLLFEKQSTLKAPLLLSDITSDPGAEGAALQSCLSEHRTAREVSRQLEIARRHGVDRTPTMFINGARMTGALAPEMIESRILDAIAINRPARPAR